MDFKRVANICPVIKYYNNILGLVDPLEPYSYVVSAGQTLYLAGQVALDKNGLIVGTTMQEQATQVWQNIKIALNAAGSRLENIVKINYFLRDIRELNDEIEIRKKLFETYKFPAVTAIQAAALGLPGLLLEVDIVAVANDA